MRGLDSADLVLQWLDFSDLEPQQRAGRGVRRAEDRGIDVTSDGEMSKPGFRTYVSERSSGFDGQAEFQRDDVGPFPDYRTCPSPPRRREPEPCGDGSAS
jgi:hypothetical protein